MKKTKNDSLPQVSVKIDHIGMVQIKNLFTNKVLVLTLEEAKNVGDLLREVLYVHNSSNPPSDEL